MQHRTESTGSVGGKRERFTRRLALVCVLAFALGACDGSNVFRPCDPDGDTPHSPCPEPTN